MTGQHHPITPPPELVKQWAQYQGFESPEVLWRQIATQAARWGADQELEACCEYLTRCAAWEPEDIQEMRDLRRPKPPSLKEQALAALQEAACMADDIPPQGIWSDQIDTIRRALNELPE
jgi:hypothetical protein